MSQRRRIFIGDIQGCREELEELLESVSFDPAADEIHPVGDVVNRGPDSLGTLRLLQSLEAGALTFLPRSGLPCSVTFPPPGAAGPVWTRGPVRVLGRGFWRRGAFRAVGTGSSVSLAPR